MSRLSLGERRAIAIIAVHWLVVVVLAIIVLLTGCAPPGPADWPGWGPADTSCAKNCT